uniref:Uncharacterized protein n=1 Tax=Anopheles coluzzii TaxID=1518534 RepID=A0A8W7PDV8_ANOCL
MDLVMFELHRYALGRSNHQVRLVPYPPCRLPGQDPVAGQQLHDRYLHLQQRVPLSDAVPRAGTERDVVVRAALDFVRLRKPLRIEPLGLGEHGPVAVNVEDFD